MSYFLLCVSVVLFLLTPRLLWLIGGECYWLVVQDNIHKYELYSFTTFFVLYSIGFISGLARGALKFILFVRGENDEKELPVSRKAVGMVDELQAFGFLGISLSLCLVMLMGDFGFREYVDFPVFIFTSSFITVLIASSIKYYRCFTSDWFELTRVYIGEEAKS